MLDKNTVYSNITHLLAEKGIKNVEIEDAANVSRGYLSRLKKAGTAYPSVEILDIIASKCNVTIESILNFNYSKSTTTDQFLKDFFEKLVSETRKDEIVWEMNPVENYRDQHGSIGDAPILMTEGSYYPGMGGYPETCDYFYKSLYNEHESFTIVDDVFFCSLPGARLESTVYVVTIGDDKGTLYGYDIYMYRSGELNKVCCTDMMSVNGFYTIVTKLVGAIRENLKRIHLNETTKNAISDFLNDDDDQLPF